MRLFLNRKQWFEIEKENAYLNLGWGASFTPKIAFVCCICKKARWRKLIGTLTYNTYNRNDGSAAVGSLYLSNPHRHHVGDVVDNGDNTLALICCDAKCAADYKFIPLGWL